MKKVLISASVISFIEWFNKENIDFLHYEMNCEVHVACDFEYMKDTDEERTKEYIQQLKDDGIILHNICFDRSPISKANLKAYKQLKEIIDDNHFNLIHCHTPVASIITRLVAKRARRQGTVVMYTCHGFHFHNKAPKRNWIIYYPIEKYFSKYCDFLVTINQEDYKRAKKFYAPNIRYIPGVGVDIDKINRARVDKNELKNSIGIPSDAFMLLSVGELIERKNHEIIIKALSKIENQQLYYVICGKGPLREYLEQMAEKYGVNNRVIFLGFRKDIPEICKTADIFAFPSKIEGLGIAGLEAMAAGIPVIASNVQGILDYVIDGKTGYTCQANDVSAFAKSISKLTNSPILRENMRENCLNVVKKYDISNALNEMWIIYREILN